MKITVVRHSIRKRGGDKLVLDYLAYFAERGHAIVYWTNEVNTTFPIHPAIQIKTIPFKGVIGTMLFGLVTHFETDVVLVDLVIMSVLMSLRNKNKMIYLAQDYDVLYHRHWFIRKLIDQCYWLALQVFKISTISVSTGLTAILQKYQPAHLTTIPNGIYLDRFYREQRSDHSKYRKNSFVILLFARNDYRKGLDIGIKALRSLKNMDTTSSSWEVWTIGSEAVEIEGVLVKNLGFLNTDEELRSVMSAVDIYLVPSRSEGLSLLLLQALACECVVVSTPVSWIIENGNNGLISPLEDADALAKNLYRVMNEDPLRLKLKSASRKLAENFSFPKSCVQFEQTLLNLNKS